MAQLNSQDEILQYNRRLKPGLIRQLLSYQAAYPDEPKTARVLDFLTGRDDLFSREVKEGHITCSAWVVDPSRRFAILIRHRRLQRWVQPGGHIEPGETPFEGACREALEETGLTELMPAGEALFHVDVHSFPEGKDGPAHLHYDLRYLFFAKGKEPLAAVPETEGAAWVALDRIGDYTEEPTILDMVKKTAAWREGPDVLEELP